MHCGCYGVSPADADVDMFPDHVIVTVMLTL